VLDFPVQDSMTAGGVAPKLSWRLFVSIATIPQRAHLVDRTVASFVRQSFLPERILVVIPRVFARWPGLDVNASLIKSSNRLLEVRMCDRDDGPGTKLLCALPRILELSETGGHIARSRIVLADDDREYRPTALSLIASAVEAVPVHAYSFARYELPDSGKLGVGQGADLFAIPIAPLAQFHVRAFFEAALRIDDRFRYHDDVWISLFLADAAAVSVCAITTVQPVASSMNTSAGGTMGPKPLRQRPPAQFFGPVHGPRETWGTALRRLGAGNETRGASRKVLNRQLGAKRAEVRSQAEQLALPMAPASERRPCEEDVGTSRSSLDGEHRPMAGPMAGPMAAAADQANDPSGDEGVARRFYAHTVARSLNRTASPIDDDTRAAERRWLHEACPWEETVLSSAPNQGRSTLCSSLMAP